jgi:hypothetical protein
MVTGSHRRLCRGLYRGIALLCTFLLLPKEAVLVAQQPAQPAADQKQDVKMPPDQLDSLVAPIALYPDPLLAQVLAASTYPLEIVQLYQWLQKHKDLKDKALADAVQKENWDPSVQSMAALPDVVKNMAENVSWTSQLGDAFLAQQSDVMDAVQRLRSKAKDSGKLQSNDQIKVETQAADNKNVVVIQQANPQVVYVPSYNPTVVWGAPPVYAYPPVAYPPPGYYAAGMAISFGVGVAMGAMWGGGWGYNTHWGGNNNITVNNNNNFNRNTNVNRQNVSGGNRANVSGGNRTNVGSGNWQHNPQHRGGAPYGDRATADRFGGTSRGDTAGNRQAAAQRDINQRGGRTTADTRSAGAGDRSPGSSSFSGDRGSANRGAGGGDQIGSRQTSGGSSRSGGAFGGSGGGGSAARSSSSRGASSYGGSRGGGGGGGGSRGGGRRR